MSANARSTRQSTSEYNVSYIYHSMWAYFSRDNVALKGFADHFKNESLEERAHAEQLMEYMNLRGGRVELQQLLPPPTEYEHGEGMRAVRPRTQSESGKIEQR